MSNTINISMFEHPNDFGWVPDCENNCKEGRLKATSGDGKPYTYRCSCMGTEMNLSSRGREVVGMLVDMERKGLINIFTEKGKRHLGIEED